MAQPTMDLFFLLTTLKLRTLPLTMNSQSIQHITPILSDLLREPQVMKAHKSPKAKKIK